MDTKKEWEVVVTVSSFDSEADAISYRDVLMDQFTSIPESEPLMAVWSIIPIDTIDETSNIEDRLLYVLVDLHDFTLEQAKTLHRSTSIAKQLNWGSLDVTEFVMALEEEFFVIIPDADMDRLCTIESTISYLRHALKGCICSTYK